MFRCSNNETRIAGRLLMFVMTASICQGLTILLFPRSVYPVRLPPQELVTVPVRAENDSVAYSPVQVTEFPEITFPKSLQRLDALDFWITVSFVVSANGEVEDISVPADLASPLRDQSFAAAVMAKVGEKQGKLIQQKLFGDLRKQLEATSFKPRISEGERFPTQLYMSSNFRWDGSHCWKVETVFTTSSGSIWDKVDGNNRLEPCLNF